MKKKNCIYRGTAPGGPPAPHPDPLPVNDNTNNKNNNNNNVNNPPPLNKLECPSKCNGHGRCVEGKCFCDFEYSGDDCAFTCNNGCNNGYCDKAVCVCRVGYYGMECENKLCPGENQECNQKGSCNKSTGECTCDSMYGGASCLYVIAEYCAESCVAPAGTCIIEEAKGGVVGKCKCEKGFEGEF